MNNLLTIEDPLNGAAGKTIYAYDEVGNQTSVTNARRDTTCPSGCVTTRVHDDKNRLVTVTDPVSNVTTYTYDENDNLETVKDGNHQANGRTVTYGYDEINRLTQIQYPDVHYKTDFTYYLDSTRKEMIDTRGVCEPAPLGCAINAAESDTTTYTYFADQMLQSVQTTFRGNTRVVSYLYDAADNRIKVTYPDAKFVDYTFDANQRMKRVTPSWIGGGFTEYTYDDAGRLDLTTLPSSTGVTMDYAYDDADRLTGITNTKSGVGTISSHAYVPNPNGNRTSATDYDGVTTTTTTFDYDVLDRLTGAHYQAPLSDVIYGYDAAGNRTTQTVDLNPSITHTNDAADQLTQISGVPAPNTHDKNGNLLRIGNDSNNDFIFDNAGRLIRNGPCRSDLNGTGTVDGADIGIVRARFNGGEGDDLYDLLQDVDSNRVINGADIGIVRNDFGRICGNSGPNTGNERNYYNGDGLRVRARTFPSSVTADHDFVWDVGAGLPVILQGTNVQSGAVTTFVYGLGLISTTSNAGATSYYLPDALGSTSQITDSAGAITDRYAYDVYGALRSSTVTTPNDFRFTGQQHDQNANRGLYYLRARYYDPSLGRFLSRDPIPFVQRYGYVGANPANLADPAGLCRLLCPPIPVWPLPPPPVELPPIDIPGVTFNPTHPVENWESWYEWGKQKVGVSEAEKRNTNRTETAPKAPPSNRLPPGDPKYFPFEICRRSPLVYAACILGFFEGGREVGELLGLYDLLHGNEPPKESIEPAPPPVTTGLGPP